jgi:hypothetical protein
MTATLPTVPEAKSPSRRAVLAGALGGLGALAASAIGRASPVHAGTDGDVVLGMGNVGANTTSIVNSANSNDVFEVISDSGNSVTGISGSSVGIYGQSTSSSGVYGQTNSGSGVRGHGSSGSGVRGHGSSGYGVFGVSDSSDGVQGQSTSHSGVAGISAATNFPAIGSWSQGNSTGVEGYSGAALPPAAKAKTGVYGYAAQDNLSRGVTGESPAGIGLYGISSSGYAGYFAGKVYTTKWYEMTEISAPAAPIANRARLFVRDNGSGKTQLCVRFPTGPVQVIKTEL